MIGERKEEVLLSADVFVQTSRTEGMPLGILEALSYGVPVLITEGAVLGDVVKKNKAGWVAKNEAEDISERYVTAINDRNRWEQMGINARQLCQTEFEWNKIGESTVLKYIELCERIGV